MKTYKVWIEIEEYDTETQEGETLDAPGAAVAEFETYKQARIFAERLLAARRASKLQIDTREKFLSTHGQDNKSNFCK